MPITWKLVTFVALATCAATEVTLKNSCPARDTLKKGICPKKASKYVDCIDACDGREVVTEKDCNQTPECCYVSGRCVLKKKSARYDKQLFQKRNAELFDDLQAKFNISRIPEDSGARNLQIPPGFPGALPPIPMGGPPLPLFGDITATSCTPFPFNCPTVSIQQIITPPLDIPYCQRQYCSKTDGSLENDMEKCLMQPGCYFDRELHTLRQSFGHQILPKVPVCHLAIRNHRFLERTEQAIEKFGNWNPALSKCILMHYAEEVYDSPKGCDMNDVIEHFGYLPKMAGWTGILKNECFLINGCWSSSRGCTYPMKMSELFIKSGQPDTPALPSRTQRFGMPKCQNFDTSTPEKFLKSYHNCLSSGCALDPAVTDRVYYYNLWNLTSTLPPQLQYLTWLDIADSNIRADNYAEALERYRTMSVPDQSFSLVNSVGSGANTRVANLLSSINTASLYSPLSFNFAGASMMNPNLRYLPSFSNVQSVKPVVKSVGPDLCPYRQVHMFNFPTLKGRFTGCCERNLCYLPPTYQNLQRSGISDYFSNWGQWAVCSKSCDTGMTSRTRVCIGTRSKKCHGVYEETKPCNTHFCPEWAQWASYLPCSVSCGGGQTYRTRKCIGKGCIGENRQDVNCNTGTCPIFSNWLHWSPCSVTCGEGTKLRTRKCLKPGDYKCPDEPPLQEKGCRAFCGKIQWSPWSDCDENTCKMTRTPRCVFNGGKGHCQDSPRVQTKWCNKLPCYCKRYPAYAFCHTWNRAR